jgi:hypothetical protein
LLEEKIQSAPPEVQQAIKALREKVHSNPIKLYLDLTKVLGKKKGFEVFKKIHAINRQWRLSYPKGTTLYEAIKQAIPAFETIGMKMAVEKISDNTAREIQRYCPWIEPAEKLKLGGPPCRIICEIDVEYTNKHKDLHGLKVDEVKIISQIAKGSDKCIFEYTGKGMQ